MLLRLSRISFWLAAIVAAAALCAPPGHETLMMAVTIVACAASFGFWRSGIASQRRSPLHVLGVTEPPPLGDESLLDGAARLVRAIDGATTLETALHAAASVLRGELGARSARVVEVREIGATQAWVVDLIEAHPGFHPLPRQVHLGTGGALGRAIATGAAAIELPTALALPLGARGRVVAVIELRGLEVRIEAPALSGLLDLARATLGRRQAAPLTVMATPQPGSVVASPSLPPEGNILPVEDNVVNPERTALMWQRSDCHVTPASGMLQAVKLPSRREWDLATVDLQPQGDYSVAVAPGMPVMVIDGSGAPFDPKRLGELSFDDDVCQPFHQGQMLSRLSKYLPARAPLGPQDSSGADGTPVSALTASSAPVLDPAALARLLELDPKGENHLLERVLKAFQVSVARLRPQAVTARASKDLAGLRLVAHTLKSSSASIGANHLSQVCAEIEATIRAGAVDDIDIQIDTLDAALDNALVAIDEQLKGRA